MIQSISGTITGNGTITLGSVLRGKVHAVKVVADAEGAEDFTVTMTGATTGVPILVDVTTKENTTTWYYPRALVTVHTTGDVSAIAVADIHVLKEAISCVLSDNASKTVTVTVYVDTPDPY